MASSTSEQTPLLLTRRRDQTGGWRTKQGREEEGRGTKRQNDGGAVEREREGEELKLRDGPKEGTKGWGGATNGMTVGMNGARRRLGKHIRRGK